MKELCIILQDFLQDACKILNSSIIRENTKLNRNSWLLKLAENLPHLRKIVHEIGLWCQARELFTV